MATLKFSGSFQRQSNGKFPSVSINDNCNKPCIVEVHQPSMVSNEIHYQVGTIDRKHKDEVVWYEERQLDHGRFPKVAINSYCNSATVVEVHEGTLFRRIYCRVGALNGQYIDWEAKSKPICSGRLPAVAVHENRVVLTFDSAYLMYTTHYCMGEVIINPQDKTINWEVIKGDLFSSGATETSVAMNGEYVVAGGRGWFSIIYQLGRVQRDGGDAHIEWINELSYDHIGYCPTICLDNDGYVIMVWQSMTLRQLLYATGRLVIQSNPPSIKWQTAANYDFGYNPTIAISARNGRVLEEHESNFAPRHCTLHYHTVSLIKVAEVAEHRPLEENQEPQDVEQPGPQAHVEHENNGQG